MPFRHATGNLGAYAFLGVGPSPDAVSRAGYLVLSESTAFATQSSLTTVLDEYREVYQAQKGWRAYAAQGGDAFIACGAELAANALAANGVSVHSYRFDHHSVNSLLPELNSTHTSELPYIFGDPTSYWQVGGCKHYLSTRGSSTVPVAAHDHYQFGPGSFTLQSAVLTGGAFSADEEELSSSMMHAWTTFAATGSPNGSAKGGAGDVVIRDGAWPEWPRYTGGDDAQVLHIKAEEVTEVVSHGSIKLGTCEAFWEGVLQG